MQLPASLRLVGRLLAATMLAAPACAAPDFDSRRREMVADIDAMYRATQTGKADPRVMEAMGRVRRHEFVPFAMVPYAYENRPLPIGEGQTIYQPYIVALMTDLARLKKDDRVLEVGTGSGYQAAILAELVANVHSIEIVPSLAATARERLARLGYRNVEVVTGDGYAGIESRAPFDAIVVTAGAPHVPPALVRQLKPGGRMVIPVGDAGAIQQLTVIEKRADGTTTTRQVIPVRFVPLTR